MKKLLLLLISTFFAGLLLAQEEAGNMEANIDGDGGSWYSSPWAWIIGAAVFILLLVAITKEKKE